MNNGKKMREVLTKNDFLTLPGIYDAMGAKMGEHLGFEALYLSGGSLSLMGLGKPDVGFLNFTDLKIALNNIKSTVEVPIITDTDNSFGNAMHAGHTAKTLCEMGIAGMQIDDNILPQKKPMQDKQAIEWDLLGPKIEAIRSNVDDDFVLILRTIIGKTEGIESAIKRANKANENGVDFVFIEGFNTTEEMSMACKESKAKLMVNMNENTYAGSVDIEIVKKMGFKIGLFPISTMHVASKAMFRVLSEIKEKGTAYGLKKDMMSFTELMEILNYSEEVVKYSDMYK